MILWSVLFMISTAISFPILPLDTNELSVLKHIRSACAPKNSALMETWCVGSSEEYGTCRASIETHPCTGLILSDNNVYASLLNATFNVPWWGLRCNASTDPASIIELDLSHQGLSCRLDSINFSFMSNLVRLELHGNQLTGSLPNWIGSMTSLEVLNLNDNRINDTIQYSIIGNSLLEELSLARNLLRGTLPNWLKGLQLKVLDLAGNSFHGDIPKDLLQSPLLEYLNLSDNNLSGPLPLQRSLQRLRHFDISHNQLIGSLPIDLHLWGRDENAISSSLESFDASFNHFDSQVPSSLRELHRLTSFSIESNNRIFGRFPRLPPLLDFRPQNFQGTHHSYSCPDDVNQTWDSINCTCIGSAIDCTVGCQPGYFQVNDTCAPCHPGSFFNGEVCTPCAPGTFANISGSINCQACPPGYISAEGASLCQSCSAGSVLESGECVACPSGFTSIVGSTCKPCPSGSFNGVPGSSECKICPTDAVALEGSLSCTTCPSDTIADRISATCIKRLSPGFGWTRKNTTIECPESTYNNGSFVDCQPCPPGSFGTRRGMVECEPCLAGTFANSSGQDHCWDAEPGSYVDTNNSISATLCPPGRYNTYRQATKCMKCANRTYSRFLGGVSCSQIPPGHIDRSTSWPHFLLTFSQSSWEHNQSILLMCIELAWSFVSVESTVIILREFEDGRRIEVCLNTTVSVLEIAWKAPQFLGHFESLLEEHGTRPQNAIRMDLLTSFQLNEPFPCPKGKFSNGTNCLDCSAGTYSPNAGSSRCYKCPLGFRAQKVGSYLCDPCQRNEYADSTATKCLKCPLFSLDLSLKCSGAFVRLLLLIFCPVVYILYLYFSTRRWIHGIYDEEISLLQSFRKFGSLHLGVSNSNRIECITAQKLASIHN